MLGKDLRRWKSPVRVVSCALLGENKRLACTPLEQATFLTSYLVVVDGVDDRLVQAQGTITTATRATSGIW